MATTREQQQQQQQQTMDEARSPAATADVAEAYESTHVHAVYEAIAPHFSSTRHSPWPRVAAYLEAQRPGAVGLDVGCGNGKYLDVNPSLHMLGSDRSGELVRLARSRGSGNNNSAAASITRLKPTSSRTEQRDNASEDNAKGSDLGCISGGTEVAVADGLALPYRLGAFDFVICIAVVHHLSTRARRVEAIGELLSRLRPSSSSPPATASASVPPTPTPGSGDDDKDPAAATTTTTDMATTRATCLVFVWALEQASSRRGWNESSEQDTLVPWVMRAKGRPNETFQRYYHLYKKGELEEDIVAAGGVVEESGYERDNWWAVFSRPQS
ncbi:tRNA methyltransferase [Cordyceps fumosorosea ARSEF 2679]|uniref:tRNA methyltransferase n=1 Tax=Cordyceps fumosorosea (strain ARSEF 2679) TaxID=1081104 RepID=A0A167S6J6_CORFA|nr:tRNA methyltransferase [Cordyceps fumosorosea ARSEF 2679]OAA59308.1 tRNA methyltransferase [Cordyceps fumosorosea ARSEF 2679]